MANASQGPRSPIRTEDQWKVGNNLMTVLSAMKATGRVLNRLRLPFHRPTTPPDLIWFQHFHKAGGTSLIDAAQSCGWQLYHPNLNGNPVFKNESFIPIWDWDSTALQDWLMNQCQNGVNFLCCEYGFSKAVFDIQDLHILKLSIMRQPKERLISNYLYDLKNGRTKAVSILDYIEEPPSFHSVGPQPFKKPDYYTRRVTGESGAAAREEAFAWLSRYDHIAFLDEIDTFRPIQKLIAEAGKRHVNRTDRNTSAYQSILQYDQELTAMIAGEQSLYNRLRAHFA